MDELFVVEGYDGGLAHGKAIHAAVELPAGGIGQVQALVVPLIEGGVAEAGVVGRRREAAVEEDEVGLGIGIVGQPLRAEAQCF